VSSYVDANNWTGEPAKARISLPAPVAQSVGYQEAIVTTNPAGPSPAVSERSLSRVVSVFGFILAISYPVLALSTGVRGSYQLLVRSEASSPWPPLMSLLAASCYLVAALGFAYRRRWSWYLSVIMLAFETVMVLLIGGLSLWQPALIGRTVWRHFGADYGYFPLIQPIIGLIWLSWPGTAAAYADQTGDRQSADPAAT
jgi:hypothetical protein